MENFLTFEKDGIGTIRTAGTADNPLFCLADLCKILDLGNPRQVKTRLDKETMQLLDLHAVIYNDGIQKYGNTMATFVNEEGLYEVIFCSRKPEAKTFRKWVFSEVLPSIRKTGQYSIADKAKQDKNALVRTIGITTKMLVEKDSTIKNMQEQITDYEHKLNACEEIIDKTQEDIQFFKSMLNFKGDKGVTVTEIANQYGMLAKEFNKLLNSLGIIKKVSGKWMIAGKYIDKGYMVSVPLLKGRKTEMSSVVKHGTTGAKLE